jgi:putative phosphotransacetylase
VHLCRADLETLFGAGRELTKLKDLTEPGEFAAREVLTLVGPRLRALDGVRILGPLRQRTQVELAFTDCILLGVEAPVRRSGDLAGTAPITLVGPCGTLRLKEGAIRANRHIHVPTAWLTHYGLQNDHEVRVRVEGEKALTFNGVQVRGGDELKLEMHLDTDDANAAAIRCGSTVEVILPDRGGCRCSSAK